MRIVVIGASVAGLTTALALAGDGHYVRLLERDAEGMARPTAWFSGGMLAPGCEMEVAEALVVRLGYRSLDLWEALGVPIHRTGSLVVAHGRDMPDLRRFARMTEGHETVDAEALGRLEPELADRFRTGLYFPQEAYLDPRATLSRLLDRCRSVGVDVHFGVDGLSEAARADADRVIDCRGVAARDHLRDLRGVKGEMAIVKTREVALTRPVRLIHPRFPLYVAPRGDGVYMIGATSIEADQRGRVTVRSALELLSAAYALHPAFGEAEILELNADVRPAFPDNLPRIVDRGHDVYVNGFYRHGWLIAPAVAQCLARYIGDGQREEEDLFHDHHS